MNKQVNAYLKTSESACNKSKQVNILAILQNKLISLQ